MATRWVRLPIWLPNGEGKSAIVVNVARAAALREYRGKPMLLVGAIEYELAVSFEHASSLLCEQPQRYVKALPLMPSTGTDGVELGALCEAGLTHVPIQPAVVLAVAVTGDLSLVSMTSLRVGDREFAQWGMTRLELAAVLRHGRRVIAMPEVIAHAGVPIRFEVRNSSKDKLARVAAALIVREGPADGL